jgi:hypothetical protein
MTLALTTAPQVTDEELEGLKIICMAIAAKYVTRFARFGVRFPEIVQVAMVGPHKPLGGALRAHQLYQPPKSYHSWVGKAINSALIDYLRKLYRQHQVEQELRASIHTERMYPPPDLYPELRDELAKLDPLDRSIVAMIMAGYTHDEITPRVSIGLPDLRGRLKAARRDSRPIGRALPVELIASTGSRQRFPSLADAAAYLSVGKQRLHNSIRWNCPVNGFQAQYVAPETPYPMQMLTGQPLTPHSQQRVLSQPILTAGSRIGE